MSAGPIKVLAFAFCEMRRFALFFRNDQFAGWKAHFFLLALESYWFVSILAALSVAFSHLLFPKSKAEIAALLSIVLLLFAQCNYYFLIKNDSWKNFQAEFDRYSRRKLQVLRSILVGFIVLTFLVLFFASKYSRLLTYAVGN